MRDDVLRAIVDRKRHDVAARERRTPLVVHQARAARLPRPRDLAAALAAPGPRFILECKAVSPSEGPLRLGLDPVEVARAYSGVADAISVVTDGPFFGGDLSMLAAVRLHCAVPVLCKDFVVSPYQVVEARALGADAILLMLSVLGDDEAYGCLSLAASLGMDCLVEVHDEAELARAVALPAPIIGINNRDLRSLRVDLAVTERLAPRVPGDRLLVSESGIRARADVARLEPLVDAFLVGSALMRRADLAAAARELVCPPARGASC
jgi:indole-3-glycerol phosphate synthase / phosphoribosylanthranilate isomerase